MATGRYKIDFTLGCSVWLYAERVSEPRKYIEEMMTRLPRDNIKELTIHSSKELDILEATHRACDKCGMLQPVIMFKGRHSTRCNSCCRASKLQIAHDKKEASGKLFANTRRWDSLRADRLDEHRKRAKLGLPLVCDDSVLPQPQEDEYHNFYTRTP